MATSRASAAPLAAYVLHSHDWSETSLIVELFTRERGRVVVAAKGAKRPTSQLRPVLLPFQPIAVQLGRTPADEAAEIHTLKSAEWVGGRPLMPAAAMFSAYYLNELLLKGLPRQDAHPLLFDAYAQSLALLAAPGDESPTLRAFELVLLRELGFLPDLTVETQSARAIEPGRAYTLSAESGLVRDGDGISGMAWTAIAAMLQDDLLIPLRAACTPVAPRLRNCLRALLHYHLAFTTLRTRQVLQDLQKLADSAPPER